MSDPHPGYSDSMTTEFPNAGRYPNETAFRVVAIARSWIGTPYHHQASVKNVGCDCLGLVRGVYAEVYGQVLETPPPYTRDLAEASQRETLLEAARRHLIDVGCDEYAPGDVVVFRLRQNAMAKHCAIVTLRGDMRQNPGGWKWTESDEGRMIHAFEGAPVCEVHMSRWWVRHIAAVFRFPKEPRKWR